MDIKDQVLLILGGSGLVGHAIARRLLEYEPKQIVLMALYEKEVEETARELNREVEHTEISTAWGNAFLPTELAQLPREELENPKLRASLVDSVFDPLTDDVLKSSYLYHLVDRYRPAGIIDCINTATAFAYQDVFTSARRLMDLVKSGSLTSDHVEKHLLTLTMPQLIRHIQIMVGVLKKFEVEVYAKVGTSGTGGMGLNVPYTHSEEKPSRMLLTKAAVAGAHSLLLFLMGRTPDAPATVEIKPTAAIGWRRIGYGPITRRGKQIPLFDCPEPLDVEEAFQEGAKGWKETDRFVESVYIDVGENGLFAKDEFETITSLGSMELITPEEVADYVVLEVQGRPSGRDVVAALDSATAGPTYRAGVLRSAALSRLAELEREHQERSVAFEMLGPPRLTKHLYESCIWSRVRESVADLAKSDADQLSRDAVDLVARDEVLRSRIVSVGLPIVVPGPKVYRAEQVMVQLDGRDPEEAIPRGWVDLRPANCQVWIERACKAVDQDSTGELSFGGTGSDANWEAIRPHDPIAPAKFASWIFKYEDDAERLKR